MRGGVYAVSSRGTTSLVLAVFLLAFACALICGAPRLIANYQTSPYSGLPEPIGAYLCSSETAAQDAARETAQLRRDNSGERLRSVTQYTGPQAKALVFFGCDANGNVLQAVSYMRSVYHVFDLGDGFA